MKFFFSAAERGANKADIKNERFHRQLEVILRPLFTAQEPGALHDVPQYSLVMLSRK
jgi:hypothetical protein